MFRQPLAAALLAAFALSCGVEEEFLGAELEADESILEAGGDEALGLDDVVLPAPPVESTSEYGSISQGLGAPQVVYVNFDGPTIDHCACSDAINNRSLVIDYAFKKPSMKFQPYTSTTGRRTIMANLKKFFAAYNITFTTTRPASGPYTMLVITPTYWAHHGVAPLDCNNANPSDIGFVFRTGNTRFYTTPVKIAQAAAHELGHSLGLAHVTARGEAMQWASSGQGFGRSTYDTAHPSGKCFSGNTQDAPAMLNATVGPKIP